VWAALPPQPRAVAGLLLATLWQDKSSLSKEAVERREMQKARRDARIHFSAAC
jgi:hypothetical protein